jgi:hypothetical protein
MNSVDCELSDRRRESRAATGGEVLLTIEGARKVEVRARIMDQSPSGFRVEHDCADLSSGAEVTFHYHSVSGRARVVWTLILGPVKQSGFLVLSR